MKCSHTLFYRILLANFVVAFESNFSGKRAIFENDEQRSGESMTTIHYILEAIQNQLTEGIMHEGILIGF